MNNIYYLFLLFSFIKLSFNFHEINQAVFLNPQTNSAIIQCPLDSLDIQWYDVINQKYQLNRGRYYRINGLQPFDRELICESILLNEKFKIKIRTYDRPLPIQHVRISGVTNTSLTVRWKDDSYNQNANITSYELILKYNNIIQSRILVNNTISAYTFSSLHSNTFYSIDISVIDIWKRSSRSITIFSLNSNKIIDDYLLDQSISCYYFNSKFLLIEFNHSKYEMLNHIYNITIYNNHDRIILTDNLYSFQQNSFIYYLKTNFLKYKILLIVSTIQSEYLGKISKYCEDFYPIYSPLTCSIKLINQNKYHLLIHMQLNKHLTTLKPNYIFYQKSQNYLIKKKIYDIRQYMNDNIIDIKENYSIIVENNFINKKLNISILCPINRTVSTSRISTGIIISLVLLIISLITLVFIIAYHRYVSNIYKDNDFDFIKVFENICETSTDAKGSYIDGYEKTNAYIAIQGPIVDTINDFWRMIWEKDVNLLVMITNKEEYGRIKYDVYWPEEGTEIYGNIEVTLVNTISLAYYIKRIFTIQCKTNQKVNYKRFVHQFHYTDWPDYDLPIFSLPVLSFIRRSSYCNSETGGPIVVHCSTGIDHIGTYIVIDTMLKKLNDKQSLNIPSLLKHIRQQRNNLVQIKEQFIFIYDVLLEELELLNIGYKNLDLNKQNFESIIKDLDSIKIEKQFQLILGQTNDSDEGYIHGYYRIDEFLITQHPTMSTRIDFWQMIWDNKTNIIVALYADEKIESDYWPLLNQIIDCGNFNVYLIDEYFQCEYIYRDCLLRSTKEIFELRVKIIASSYWPDTCLPIKTSFNLIDTIRNLNSTRPIIVHGHRAATFCALYTMKEQIENEGILNVYELAKFYHKKRPGIWRDNNDLLFLYHCAEILFQEYKSSVLL